MSISEPSRTSPSDPVLILMGFFIVYYNWVLVLELEIWRWDELNVELKCQSTIFPQIVSSLE